MTDKILKIYAPIQNFFIGEFDKKIEFSPGIWIIPKKFRPNLRKLNENFGIHEKKMILSSNYWINFSLNTKDHAQQSEIINIFLISLWLIKSSEAYVAFRFQIKDDSRSNNEISYRLLDRFQKYPNSTGGEFNLNELEIAGQHFRSLMLINQNRGRLRNTLSLMLSARCAYKWQVAMVCFAAAAETAMTYEKSSGITKRLSRTYACLVEDEESLRDIAYAEFCHLYNARSDIIHGRIENLAQDQRLPILAKFDDVMRKLWQAILQRSDCVAALEGSDAERKDYMNKIRGGYSPPDSSATAGQS